MLEWVEVVLKPYVALAPPHIVPIVLLDSFKVHMVGSVTSAIQALGCEVMFIPPGCTGLVQPVDVGFNKPFKAKLRAQYSAHDVAGWIIEAERAVSNATIRNAWKRTGLSYFPDQPKE